MHATAWGVIRVTQKPALRHVCRGIGCSRPSSLRRRPLHQSSVLCSIPDEPPASKNEARTEITPGDEEEAKAEDQSTDTSTIKSSSEPDYLTLSQRVKTNRRSSIRGSRQKQPRDGLPPINIPEWFWEKNINPKTGGLSHYRDVTSGSMTDGVPGKSGIDPDAEKQSEVADGDGMPSSESAPKDSSSEHESANVELVQPAKKYAIHQAIYDEITTSVRAGLKLRPPKNAETQPALRPVLILQCPAEGGIGYLDSIVESVASEQGADLVRLDAQDIAQIIGPYIDENLAWNATTTSLYGYNVQEAAGNLADFNKESSSNQGEEDEEEEMPGMLPGLGSLSPSGKPGGHHPGRFLSKILSSMGRSGTNAAKPEHMRFPGGDVFALAVGQAIDPIEMGRGGSERSRDTTSINWSDLKLTAALEALVGSADKFRADQQTTADPATRQAAESPDQAELPTESVSDIPSTKEQMDSSKDIVIHLKDYKEFQVVPGGSDLLTRLRGVVNKKWQEGRNIILVGTSSSEQGESALEKSEIQKLQEGDDRIESEKRIIFVPPERTDAQSVVFNMDEKARIRSINIRHVEDMIKKLAEGTYQALPPIDLEEGLDSATAFSAELEDAVWSFSTVHRLATILLGMSPDSMTGVNFSTAMNLLYESDEVKFKWGAAEIKKEDEEVEAVLEATESEKKKMKDRIAALRKKCNRYEQNLLSGVIMPGDITTTFDDIRVPKETIESLKSLTSLSLLRPEAFSYGVLATDKIPGLLLYGPPGTGKTLLAKAVAKESGATVLEVTGADLNNMFVGEGEKNVRAVFSLAKKLSPCVVFVDEVDSVFASRETSRQRGGQREMINRFLREWDGLNSLSAFIMVATNRPFDLDDAILRRLPRRILVDLPNEKDRESILKIHLKDEILHDDVSLSNLAKESPFYSGSDLKNLCVAAALACIREENVTAAAAGEAYKHSEKRTLMKKHFDHALGEISASISEDMSSLTAIKKFDEKYGDRKGRRKKGPSMGFGGTKTVEKDSEAARVRKSVVE